MYPQSLAKSKEVSVSLFSPSQSVNLEVRCQMSEVGGQVSEIGGQGSEIRNGPGFLSMEPSILPISSHSAVNPACC